MTEVHFYHLQRQSLDAVLPTLLVRSRERGWRALVKVGSEARLAALDDHLWTYADESFLPHGTARDPDAADHPIVLTLDDSNPNEARILFLADGAAMPDEIGALERMAVMLDGRDEEAVAAARDLWRRLRGAGHAITYWQQDDQGRWRNRA